MAALVLGLCGLAASAAGVVSQLLPRHFSAVQQRQIMAWETARRWRTTSAGRIFPSAVTYQLPGSAVNSVRELALTARRLGIARQASCGAATDPAAARILDRFGCQAILRATYVDSTGSMIAIVGVAVLPSSATAAAAAADLAGGRAAGGAPGLPARQLAGVQAVAFPRTVASAFRDPQRQLAWAVSSGPYVIMSAAGYADGRPRVPLSSDRYTSDEMSSFADGVADAIGVPLGSLPRVPRCPGAPGC